MSKTFVMIQIKYQMRDYRSLRACVFLESIEICLIVNFWFIFDTTRKAPACGVYISQLELYFRVCFFLSGKQWKLKKQEFILEQLKSSKGELLLSNTLCSKTEIEHHESTKKHIMWTQMLRKDKQFLFH
jgi:hypothetical protein